MASHIRNSALYRDRLTENELISDYPADEPLIGGLHALQAYFVAQGQYIDIPVVRVMNAAHFLACYMFSIPCTDRNEYDVILYEYVGYDKQLALITLVVLAAMLRRTDAPRARTCRSVLLEDRSDDLYEGVSLYEKFVNDTQQTFPTEAFDTDIMREVISLRNQNKELIQEVFTLQSTLDTMKQNLNQYNAPVYQGCTFTTNNVTNNNYYQAPSDSQPDTPRPHDTPQPPFKGGEKEDRCADRVQTVNTDRSAGGLTDLFTQRAEDILGIPRENKYTEVRRYIEERKRFDPEFSNYCRDHSLRSLCERLTKEFGWFVDEHSLGANLNRNR